MFETILTNFSLIFTFTILVFWPRLRKERNQFSKYFTRTQYSALTGIEFGIIGLILGYVTLDYFDGVLFNARIIFILFSGVLGGPLSLFISGFIMNVGRIILFPMTDLSFILSINALLVLIGFTYFASKYRVTFKNIHHYIYYALFEMAIVSLFYFDFSFYGIQFVLLLTSFSLITFWAIHRILYQSQVASEQARNMMALRQVDYLTQLPNNYAIEAYLKNMTVHNVSFSFLHIDIDDFKQYNNQYSYLIGDHILQEVAELIKKFGKGKDTFIGRIGGEEYCYIMKEAAPAIAIHEANALRNVIENYTFGRQHGLDLKVTISIGISSMPDNGSTIEQIFVSAASALQASKKTSFNRVYHYNQYLKDIEFTHL